MYSTASGESIGSPVHPGGSHGVTPHIVLIAAMTLPQKRFYLVTCCIDAPHIGPAEVKVAANKLD